VIFSSSFLFLRFSSQNVWPLRQSLAKTRKRLSGFGQKQLKLPNDSMTAKKKAGLAARFSL
jgi:hypothetical protein